MNEKVGYVLILVHLKTGRLFTLDTIFETEKAALEYHCNYGVSTKFESVGKVTWN